MRANWSKAPEWANWAAQELSGTIYFHEQKPKWQPLTGEWVSKGRAQIDPRVDTQAQDTLEARPKGPYILNLTPEQEADLVRELVSKDAVWGPVVVGP